MKKQLKTVLALALCAMMLLALCACGGGSSVANTKWALKSAEMDGMTIDASMLAMIGAEFTLTFTSNTWEINMMGDIIEGTYTEDGGKIAMTSDGETVPASVNGNTLTMEQDGQKMIFEKK
ncbi:MAG: hypothetical protein E7328_02690 [Clostridiales bacterium]|nr:hypothetical protein [Clostridiales bacterium]